MFCSLTDRNFAQWPLKRDIQDLPIAKEQFAWRLTCEVAVRVLGVRDTGNARVECDAYMRSGFGPSSGVEDILNDRDRRHSAGVKAYVDPN